VRGDCIQKPMLAGLRVCSPQPLWCAVITTEHVIRWSTVGAVVGVAAAAAMASYKHAYALARAHGEAGWAGASGAVDSRRADLREFHADARLGAPEGTGSVTGAVAAGSGHRGDARGQRRPWPRARPDRCSSGCMAGDRTGRVVRASHDVIRNSQVPADGMPADGETRIRCRKEPPRCSPSSLRQTGFPRSVRSRSPMSASHVHSVCGTTLLQGPGKPGQELAAQRTISYLNGTYSLGALGACG
jgi:hypothetical protein